MHLRTSRIIATLLIVAMAIITGCGRREQQEAYRAPMPAHQTININQVSAPAVVTSSEYRTGLMQTTATMTPEQVKAAKIQYRDAKGRFCTKEQYEAMQAAGKVRYRDDKGRFCTREKWEALQAKKHRKH